MFRNTLPAMRSLRLLLATALGVMLAVILYGMIEARSDPVVRHVHVIMVGADPNAPPLRLALVSDIHVGNLAMPVWRLNRVVDQINAQQPDAILLAGDFVNGGGDQSWDFNPELLAAPLSRLHAPLGVHAVMGNHDIASAQPAVEAALMQAGIDVLDDRAERIGPIALIGMSMNDAVRTRIAPVLTQARHMGGFPVLMTHAPPFPGQLPDDIPLILAGHTHCGQIVLGAWDNSYNLESHARRFPPWLRCGIGYLGRQVVVVTGGVGAATIPPMRLNAPPDFWILTLAGSPRRSR
jgi:predicted MPP superfamily phosphohydrolase